MFRQLAIGLIAAVLAQAAPAAAQKVQISASSVSLSYTPVYVGQVLGYFKQYGVDAEVIPSNSGPASIAAVASGSMDTVLGSAGTMLTARQNGGDVIIIATMSGQFGASAVVTAKWAQAHNLTAASTYQQRIAALKGVNVAITAPGGGPDQLLRFLALEGGINPDREFTIVTIPEVGSLLAAFSQDRIDGFVASSPTSPQAVRDFKGFMLFNTNTGQVPALNGYTGGVIGARKDWMAKNADMMTRFSKGLQLALDAIHDPARTIQVRDAVHKARFAQMDPGFFAELWNETEKAAPATAEINRDRLKTVIDFTNRFSATKLDSSLLDVGFTNEYSERARALK